MRIGIMKTYELKAKPNKDAGEETFTITAPETLTECVEAYGEEIVFDFFNRSRDIDAQSKYRAMRTGNDKTPKKSADASGKLMAEYVPKVGRKKQSPAEKVAKLLEGVSAEQKAEILAALPPHRPPPHCLTLLRTIVLRV